jgi:hypothetical protein
MYSPEESGAIVVMLGGSDKSSQVRDMGRPNNCTMSKSPPRPFDMVNSLNDEEDVTVYLNAAIEDGDIVKARRMTHKKPPACGPVRP